MIGELMNVFLKEDEDVFGTDLEQNSGERIGDGVSFTGPCELGELPGA